MTKNIETFRSTILHALNLCEIKDEIPKDATGVLFRGGIPMVCFNDFRPTIDSLIDSLIDSNITIKNFYSEGYLRESIIDFVKDLKVDTEKDKTKKIDSFFKSEDGLLKPINTFVATYLIEGLSSDSTFTIGEVCFKKYSEENYIDIFTELGVKEHICNLMLELENNDFVSLVGIVEIDAGDGEKALEKAQFLIEEALDVLRICFYKPNFGIKDTLPIKKIGAALYNKNTNNITGHVKYKDHRKTNSFDSNQKADFLKKYGFANIDVILKKQANDRTDMEKKLITAIQWFAEISKHPEDDENIIRLFIGLEALLIIGSEEKKKNIAEKLALINYSDKASRMKINTLARNMYEHRNSLVHEGKTNFKKADFDKLYSELRNCIINVALNIHQHPKFEDWDKLISDTKFSIKLGIKQIPQT